MAALALALLANLARAEDKPNPTGTWKWTVQAGGQAREQTIKLKLEGDKLTGASVARNGQETAIEEATFKDDTVSFKVTRERQGMKIIQKFSGKVSGDTIKGKISTDRDGQTRDADWEAKRAKDA
jgi:hypothetical protein